MFWTFKKSFDVDVEKLGDLFSKNLVTLNMRVFVPGKPFQPSQMFVGKAGAYLSLIEAPFKYSALG